MFRRRIAVVVLILAALLSSGCGATFPGAYPHYEELTSDSDFTALGIHQGILQDLENHRKNGSRKELTHDDIEFAKNMATETRSRRDDIEISTALALGARIKNESTWESVVKLEIFDIVHYHYAMDIEEATSGAVRKRLTLHCIQDVYYILDKLDGSQRIRNLAHRKKCRDTWNNMFNKVRTRASKPHIRFAHPRYICEFEKYQSRWSPRNQNQPGFFSVVIEQARGSDSYFGPELRWLKCEKDRISRMPELCEKQALEVLEKIVGRDVFWF